MRFAGKYFGFLFCVNVLISAAAGQDSTPLFKARTDVVLVPVIVRDSSGAHVKGLSKADFTVLEHGKPQTLSVFEEVHPTAAAQRPKLSPGTFSNALEDDSGPQRITIIALDLVNTSFSDQAYARWQLLKFLNQSLDSRQSLALVEMRLNGIRMLHDFTTDSATLVAALKGISGSAPSGPNAIGRVDRGVSSDVIKLALTAGNINANANDPRVKVVADEVERFLAFEFGADDEFTSMRRNMMQVTLESLQHLAQAFAGIPGKKSLVWITGGFPFDLSKAGTLTSPTRYSEGTTNVTASEASAGIVGHLPESTALLHDDSMKVLEPLYNQTMRALSSANIAVYPVDAAGLVADFPGAESQNINLGIARESRERHRDVMATLSTFASMTGGNPCFNTNDLRGCFDKATRDTEDYYLVGYNRDQKNNKSGWRPLEVKVASPGAQVRSRSGYLYTNENPSANNVRQMDVALALSSPMAYTALPFTVRLQKTAEAAQKGKKPYKFVMSIPATSVSIDDKNNVSMEFIAAAVGPKGDREDQIAQHVAMQLKPDTVTKMRTEGLNYDNKLLLSPGSYMIHFIVRDNQTGRTGSVVATVEAE